LRAGPLVARTSGPSEKVRSLESRGSVSELVEGGDDAVEPLELASVLPRFGVAGSARHADGENDLAPAVHGAFEANGAIRPGGVEALACVQTDRVDGAPHLPGEIGVEAPDDAREAVNGADGFDDVIEDAHLHGPLLGWGAGRLGPASPPQSAGSVTAAAREADDVERTAAGRRHGTCAPKAEPGRGARRPAARSS